MILKYKAMSTHRLSLSLLSKIDLMMSRVWKVNLLSLRCHVHCILRIRKRSKFWLKLSRICWFKGTLSFWKCTICKSTGIFRNYYSASRSSVSSSLGFATFLGLTAFQERTVKPSVIDSDDRRLARLGWCSILLYGKMFVTTNAIEDLVSNTTRALTTSNGSNRIKCTLTKWLSLSKNS